MPTFNERSAECLVFTYKEGLLSAIGHDLMLRAGRFHVAVDGSPLALRARVDAASLRVVAAMINGAPQGSGERARGPLPPPLGEEDKRKIEQMIGAEILEAARYPEIHFASSAVVPVGDGYHVEGLLTLRGQTRRIAFDARTEGDTVVAEVGLHQPDFGIKPYAAMLGALKIKPGVTLRITVPRA